MKVILKRLIITFILAFSIFTTHLFSSTSSDINTLINKYKLEKSHIALKIISLPEGKIIYERNADELMTIASNVKLFTTASALCKLGPDFKFTTSLFYDGVISAGGGSTFGGKDNILQGDLIVRSNGDPNVSGRFYNNNPTAIFEQWADELLKLGIKSISGNIVLDDSAFDRDYYMSSWPKDQLTYWYCAPISAISFNDNCVEITVSPDGKSGKVKCSVSPQTKYVNISLDVDLDKKISENQLTFYRLPETNNITIKGKISAKGEPYKEFVTVHNPPLFFGTVFKEVLTQKNIMVNGKILCLNNSYQSASGRLVKTSEVQTDLAETIKVINKRSQNFYAEQVLKYLAYHFKGKGSFTDGLEIVRNFLHNEVGITRGTYFISDGSGLSTENWFSANQIITLLSYLNRHKNFSIFRDSLNTERWSLKGNKSSQRLIWVKTGYLKNVLSFSGYVSRESKNGYYAFSLIINDFESQIDGLKKAERFRDDFIQLFQWLQ